MKKMLPCLMSVALGVSLPAHGHGRLADVLVIDRRTEQPLPVYYARGTYWVAGEAGARYGIAIRNRLGERLMAVTSVDGINVISGEPAAIDQVGYVLPAYVRFDVTGWRKSDSDVAAFEFTTPGSSYAARTGRPANVGVLGVAAGTYYVTVTPTGTKTAAIGPLAVTLAVKGIYTAVAVDHVGGGAPLGLIALDDLAGP